MKRMLLTLLCAVSLATQCELPEKTRLFYTIPTSVKETLRRLDKQAGHVFVVGNTVFWSGIGAAAGSTIIPAAGVAVIAAHSVVHNYNKKLAATQKPLETKLLTDVIEKGASQLPH